jgi:hypothetical protein
MQTVVATNRSRFSWPAAVDVRYVRGDLESVDSYPVDVSGALAAALSLGDAASPPVGDGWYYLFRPDCPAGSWQTAPGAEPGRDAVLP